MGEMDVVKDKSQSPIRWLVLLLTCTLMVGNYYCYDIPAALHSQMDDYMGKPSDFETLFSLLYTVYSVPNVILPFFGGFFVDKFGVRICMIAFAVFITAGQIIFAIGLSLKSWPIMFLGRVVFGFGGESMGVANSAMLSVWFKGKEMAFAMGLNLSISRLGSVINNVISPMLAADVNIEFALWFGVILCAGSVMSAFGLAAADKYMDARTIHGTHSLLQGEDGQPVKNELIKDLVSNNEEEEKEGEDEKKPGRSMSVVSAAASVAELKEVSFSDVLSYKPVFWLLALICVIVYGK